ncbi:ABC transporter substrate-binding protein [Microvirga zambiensis]|uniref:ABC transporter substrate-binding protein n=1 Tax=Microvirga zambiensis TaxID=1402137 RepID=UPI00191E02CF|nr:ABC transporter substrate-binding protein [Microvirga zambiensis]
MLKHLDPIKAAVFSGLVFAIGSILTPPAHAQTTIPVGICQSTAQGPAKFATALWKGAELVLQSANASAGADGIKLEPVPVDIGNNDPAQARLSFNKAFQVNKIQALICWGTNVMVQNGSLIDEAGVAAFTTSSGVNVVKNSKLTQQIEAVTTLQCAVAAKHVKERYPEVKTFGILYVNYEFGIEMRDQCEIEFGKVGIKLVAAEGHPNAPADLRAQTTKILEAKPDAIYLAPIGGGTVPLGIRAGRELGFKGLFITYTAGDTPDVYNLKLAENNFFFVSHDVPEGAPQSVHEATKSYGGYVGMGYDFAWIVTSLAQQLKQEGKEISGRNLITKLREIQTVKTPVNEYRFLPDGNTVRPLALFSVAGGGRKLEQSLTPSQLQ